MADWGCCCCYLREAAGVAAANGAGGVVGDGLGADVTGGPEDAGADDLRAHRVRGQALLVPSPEPPHPRRAGQARREQFHGKKRGEERSVRVPPFPLFISFFSLFFR